MPARPPLPKHKTSNPSMSTGQTIAQCAQRCAERADGLVVALVAAAGIGRRLGQSTPKSYVTVGGRSLLQHTLCAIDDSQACDRIVIMAAEDYCQQAQREAEELSLTTPVDVHAGGVLRSDSVRIGLQHIHQQAQHTGQPVGVVAIHDAARCFTPPEVFQRVIRTQQQLMAEGCAQGIVPGLPVVDTIKEVEGDDRVVGTPCRDRLRAVQTPQCFDAELLLALHMQALEEGLATTDDAGLYEEYGLPVRVVEGHPDALKITTPQDLAYATWLHERH